MGDIEEVKNTGIIRDELGRFVEGVSGNPKGTPPLTSEQKIAKKVAKELISDYKQKLAEALPQISPVLIASAIAGEIAAIKELHDRVMGKAPQPVVGGDEDWKPIQIVFKKDEPIPPETTGGV